MKKKTSGITLLHIKPYKLPLIALALWVSTTQYGYSEEVTQSPKSKKTQYEFELERQQQMLNEQGKEIDNLKRLIKDLTPKKTVQKVNKVKKTAAPVVSKPVGKKPPETAPRIDVSSQPKESTNTSGVLTRPGALIIEPALGYAYSDNYRVYLDGYSFIPALVVGLIDLREIKRHSFTASITARYGLSDRWDFDLKIPYIVRDDSQRSRPISEATEADDIFNANGSDMGDLELSSHYQLNDGLAGGPIYVANLAVTIPTGTSPFDVEYVESTAGSLFPTELPTGSGYFSIQPSLTAIYPTDPGVLYGNISYGYTIETDEEVGKVDPGDSIGFSWGLGLSLNERTSMSLGYSHKHVMKSQIDGVKIDGSELDIGQLSIGYSFNSSQRTNINLSLNIGVTDDAPDVRLDFKLPIEVDGSLFDNPS